MEISVLVIGLVIGSFLNVLIDRLPKDQNVLWGRSHCDYCKKILRWYELIPIFSYIFQGGRCRRCKKRLSVQYPLIEAITGFGFWYLFQIVAESPVLYIVGVALFSVFLVLAVADLKYQILPDSMILAGFCCTILLFLLHELPNGFLNHGISSLGAGLFFYALWVFTKGKGMGFGDVKLAFLVGLLVGFPGIVACLYIAFLTGAIVGVILILRGYTSLKSKIAFGPFIILGMISWIMFQIPIMEIWYKLV